MPAFRIKAKNLFLTYPRCLETPLSLIEFLREKLSSRNPLYICVAEEEHEDGVPHLHAFVSLEKTLDTQNCRYFDAGDYHGSYEGAKHPRECLDYVTKEGNYEEWGDLPDWLSGGEKKRRKQIFADMFAAATIEEAEEIAKSEAPDTYATCYNNIQAALKAHFKPLPTTYQSGRTIDDFVLPDGFWDWYFGNFMVSVGLGLVLTGGVC